MMSGKNIECHNDLNCFHFLSIQVYSLPSHGREKAHIREGTTALRSAVVSVGGELQLNCFK